MEVLTLFSRGRVALRGLSEFRIELRCVADKLELEFEVLVFDAVFPARLVHSQDK